MAEGGAEKTEKASGKKRNDERKKGNIFQSKDVVTVASMITSFYIIKAFIMSFFNQSQLIYRNQMNRALEITSIKQADLTQIFIEVAKVVSTTILPAAIIIGFIAILATGLQTKFLVTRETLKFKISRINPLQGMKKFVSLKSLVELAKSLLKITIVLSILYNQVVAIIAELPAVIDYDFMQAAAYAGSKIMSLLMTVAIAFVGIAALDFLYQRYEYEKSIKMTKQEVKDEYKQMEGNPQVKGKRREKQREMAMTRMMGAVKQSDVVVRNPTHYAVALRYDLDLDAAPVVLAKGADLIAARIVAEAEKHGIATVENPPLARGLYAAAEIEEAIPAEFFQPVAELLAWIFTTRKEQEKKNTYIAKTT